ncbi:MAG TPA: HAD hydrolase-like protein, partial [Caulobacter sp.]|nr:HAD hydrolase-like protein [Caulobacter sp.]
EPPVQVRLALEELGPAFVKFGQILAGRADLFGPEWIAEFEKLHSQVPAVPIDALRPQLREDLGAEPEAVFAWIVGPDRDMPLYDGLGLETAGPDDAAFVAVTGMVDDESEVPDDYRDRLAIAADRGLTLICANPDRVVQRGSRLIYCGGSLADLYEALGGEVLMAGKPYKPIYDLALAEAQALKGGPVDRSRVLCIGDGVITDVKGAHDEGLACLFIAKGIHGEHAVGPDGRLDPARVEGLLAAERVGATHAMADLVW